MQTGSNALVFLLLALMLQRRRTREAEAARRQEQERRRRQVVQVAQPPLGPPARPAVPGLSGYPIWVVPLSARTIATPAATPPLAETAPPALPEPSAPDRLTASQEVVVPNVRGQLLEEAQQQLEAKGISSRLRERPSSDPPGTVLQQYPQGGASVGRRSQVTLYVSPPTHEPRPED